MSEPREKPQLKLLVNAETGEVIEDGYAHQLEELNRKYLGVLGENGKLRKELARLRLAEPESETIMDILRYCNERWGKRHEIAPDGVRWDKVRSRLTQKLVDRSPWTPDELKLAADGALLDDWIAGRARNSPGYLDAKTVFRDEKIVQDLRDLALGFKAQAGIHLSDLLEVASELRVVKWGFLLRKCLCGHRRIEHRKGCPESCSFCECEDWDEDIFDPFNERQYGWAS